MDMNKIILLFLGLLAFSFLIKNAYSQQCNTLECGDGYCCKQMDSCANGYRYTARSCSDGLKCCYDLGSTERGICRTECFNPCNNNGVCDTDIGETSDSCADCRTNSIGSSSATTTVIIVMIIGLFVFGSYKIVKSVLHPKSEKEVSK